MPFQSRAQMRLMFAKHPLIARRWAKEHPEMDVKSLPEHKGEMYLHKPYVPQAPRKSLPPSNRQAEA